MKTSTSAAKSKNTPQQTRTPAPAPGMSNRSRRPSHGEMLRRIIPGALANARNVMRAPPSNATGTLQAKMRVSQPHDPQEKEADETAAKIMNMPEPAVAANTPQASAAGTGSSTGSSIISTARIAAQATPPVISEVQRESVEREVEQESEEERDDEHKAELTRKTASASADGAPQDQDEDDRREDGAGSALQRRGGGGALVDENIEAKIRALRGRGQALPPTLKEFYERRFGRDFSQVRIHTDGPSADLAKKVNAKAFAVGPNVVFGKGYYQPGTRDGRELMAHELTHVVQQGRAPLRRESPAQAGARNQSTVATPAAQHLTAPATRGPAIQRRTVEGGTVHRQSDVESGPILDRIRKYADTFAGNLPGYRLMTFVIGLNPITGEKVQRTPLNFVRAVVALLPGGDIIFQRVQQSKALVSAFNWLVKEFTKLGITWPLVKGLLKIALKRLGDLGILDLLSGIVAKATKILNDVFGPTLRKLVGFVGKVATKIKEFIFRGFLRLVGGREGPVFQFFNPIVNLLGRIFNDPVSFGRNLIGAVKLGFTQFMRNFVQHFKGALFGWLFGTFSKAGINVPTSFEPVAIFRFITELFAITWQDIRAKLVKRLGPKGNTIITAVEKTVEVVQVLMTEGPAGLWKQIQSDLGDLKETILSSVLEWVRNTIIVKAIVKIASMLNPVGAIVQAVLAIYNTVMFFIERFEQIKALVLGVMEALQNIVVGKIGPAANHVEKTMGRALTLVISFLARFIGLGDIVKPVKAVITKIKKRIDAAIDKIINAIVKSARRLLRNVKTKVKDTKNRIVAWWTARKVFKTTDGASHKLYFSGSGRSARLMVASAPQGVRDFLNSLPESKKKTGNWKVANDEFKKVEAIMSRISKRGNIANSAGRSAQEKTDRGEIERALAALSVPLAKLGLGKADLPLTKLAWTSSIGSTPVTTRAMKVIADPLTNRPGNTKGSIADSSLRIAGWDHVDRIKGTTGQWNRVHLVSFRMHGPGNRRWNLVPGLNKTNSDMKAIENEAEKKITAGSLLKYQTTVSYNESGGATDEEKRILKDFPSAIKVQWEEFDPETKKSIKKHDPPAVTPEPPILEGEEPVIKILNASRRDLLRITGKINLSAQIVKEKSKKPFKSRADLVSRMKKVYTTKDFVESPDLLPVLDAAVTAGNAEW